jgi:hypothetical protein
MPRFVILEHDHPSLHWDFMLEAAEVLRTWRLCEPPCAERPVRAEPSFDHRLHYLDYEGPVSGGRGSVKRWDAGQFSWQKDEATGIVVKVAGGRLNGGIEVEQTVEGEWRCRYAPESVGVNSPSH